MLDAAGNVYDQFNPRVPYDDTLIPGGAGAVHLFDLRK